MSKDEYLITDAPLKALTVFATVSYTHLDVYKRQQQGRVTTIDFTSRKRPQYAGDFLIIFYE